MERKPKGLWSLRKPDSKPIGLVARPKNQTDTTDNDIFSFGLSNEKASASRLQMTENVNKFVYFRSIPSALYCEKIIIIIIILYNSLTKT